MPAPSSCYPLLSGTLSPSRRASLSPIAIACFRFFTFLPERPDCSFPSFISCIARSTLRPDLREYFRVDFLRPFKDVLRPFDDFFRPFDDFFRPVEDFLRLAEDFLRPVEDFLRPFDDFFRPFDDFFRPPVFLREDDDVRPVAFRPVDFLRPEDALRPEDFFRPEDVLRAAISSGIPLVRESVTSLIPHSRTA